MDKRGERGWGWPKNGLNPNSKKSKFGKKTLPNDLHLLKDNNSNQKPGYGTRKATNLNHSTKRKKF